MKAIMSRFFYTKTVIFTEKMQYDRLLNHLLPIIFFSVSDKERLIDFHA